MSPIRFTGLAFVVIGAGATYFGLYTSDSLLLLGGAILHFSEHMQLLWSQLAPLPRIYVGAGLIVFILGLLLLLLPRRGGQRHSEFF